MAEDIGESLVGSYLRYVENCEFVLFNTFLPGVQGEIDVIGIRLGEPRDNFFAEVTTHIGGMTYGGNSRTVEKVRDKLERAEKFAHERFPGDRYHFSVWSPRVPVGAMTTAFDAMAADFKARDERLSFVINQVYGDRIAELVEKAKNDTKPTNDPAFRLLQILGRVQTSAGPLTLLVLPGGALRTWGPLPIAATPTPAALTAAFAPWEPRSLPRTLTHSTCQRVVVASLWRSDVSVPITALPTHERPRERLLARGVEALSDQELVALVLRNGALGVNATDLAACLLSEHGGLQALARARPEELARNAGIGPAKASALVAAFALGRRAARSTSEAVYLRTAEDVANAARRELDGLRRERVVVLVCDAANRLTHTEVISSGSVDRSLVPVRETLNAVLRHDGRAFAIAHNHPSGDPAPSAADQRATAEVREGAGAVGLRFLGHVVIAGDAWQAVS